MALRRTTDDPLAWATPGAHVAYVDDDHPDVVEERTIARTTSSSIVTSDGERWRRRALQGSGPWAGALVVLSGIRAKRLAPRDHPQVVGLRAAGDDATSPHPAPRAPTARWGRPVVPEIPVPPFRTHEDALTFVEHLALWVATLGTPGLGLTHVVVLQLLDAERTRLRDPRGPVEAHLSAVVRQIAVTTLFPAPWTPAGLHAELRARPASAADEPTVTRDPGTIRWGGDPQFTARRDDSGSWTVERDERGSKDVFARAQDDDDMVLLLLRREQHDLPYPLGWKVDDPLVGRLRDAAGPTLDAWSADAALPSVEAWRRT